MIEKLQETYHLIPICPEVMGGLPTPRVPAEVQSDRKVMRADGVDVTENYRRGAQEALRLAELFGCRLAILKEKSPSLRGAFFAQKFAIFIDKRPFL